MAIKHRCVAPFNFSTSVRRNNDAMKNYCWYINKKPADTSSRF
jgi:hypothetical protein